ncbi:WD40 repeat-like protein [Mycena galericulata]|nr:WD40 repeat-like protein [Mycena galericulata]
MNRHDLNSSKRPRRPLLIPDPRTPPGGLRHPQAQRIEAVEALLARGFPYSRKLAAHTSCVNALAFSSLDGRFLASGGDDLKIHLWDLHEEEVRTPCCSFNGPRRNIFVLAFSAHNRWLYSGGVDDTVLKFDATELERPQVLRAPNERFDEHEDNIRGIAPHSVQDDVFLSASEDGRIILYDLRAAPSARARAQDRIQLGSEVTGVQFHPTMEHVFATSEGSGHVCLRDLRMAFGPLTRRTQEGVVQTYHTKLSSRAVSHLSNPETSSIAFNRDGTMLGVTMLHYFPTIYGLTDPDPLAVCSAPNLPDGALVPSSERTYANACTMKHGSFGGPGLETDTMYAAGSDDFRAYIWSLPGSSALATQRTVLSHAEWVAGPHAGVVAFAEHPTGPRCLPVQLRTPCARLGGHASIVNTVLLHPRMLLAVSAGIEPGVVVHGAVPSLLGGMQPTPARTRRVGEDVDLDVDLGLGDGEREGWEWEVRREMRGTIQMFDLFLQHETEADVFNVRKWAGSADGDNINTNNEESDSRGDMEEESGESDDSEEDVDMDVSRG